MKSMMVIATLLISFIGPAHAGAGHDLKPMHGGVIVEAKDIDVELVTKPDSLSLYLTDHGKPIPIDGGTAKLTVLIGSEKKDFELFLEQIKQKMRRDGKLIILQPNYKKCYKDYFDDYTHISIWTDVSLTDFLMANGFDVIESYPGFLPLTIKSKLPVIPILIKLYINLPLKPFGKQMLLISKLKKV